MLKNHVYVDTKKSTTLKKYEEWKKTATTPLDYDKWVKKVRKRETEDFLEKLLEKWNMETAPVVRYHMTIKDYDGTVYENEKAMMYRSLVYAMQMALFTERDVKVFTKGNKIYVEETINTVGRGTYTTLYTMELLSESMKDILLKKGQAEADKVLEKDPSLIVNDLNGYLFNVNGKQDSIEAKKTKTTKKSGKCQLTDNEVALLERIGRITKMDTWLGIDRENYIIDLDCNGVRMDTKEAISTFCEGLEYTDAISAKDYYDLMELVYRIMKK